MQNPGRFVRAGEKMIKSFARNKKSILVIAAVLALAVSFMPMNAAGVYAAKAEQTGQTEQTEQTVTARAPSQVTGVAAANTDTGIKLDWQKASNATGYQVYRKTGSTGEYSQLGTSKTNSYNDNDVEYDKMYSYKVRAYNTDEDSSVTGPFSKTRISRSSVVNTALAWLGCKESNDSSMKIIDVYNADMGTDIGYGKEWSAVFISAVAANSGASSVIVKGSDCRTVKDAYTDSQNGNYSYTAGSKYIPKAGDIVFFDWNKDDTPDHMGIVASVSGKTVKTVESDLQDAVGYRTFSIGNSYVMGYGLPKYDEANGIVYTGNENTSIGCGELAALGIGTDPEGYEDLGKEYDFVEQKVKDNVGFGDELSDYDRMVYMINKVKTSAATENINCSEAQYYAAFIYRLCQTAGIDASIVTAEDETGNTHAWVEAALDDKWYRIDVSDAKTIEAFTPEAAVVEE